MRCLLNARLSDNKFEHATMEENEFTSTYQISGKAVDVHPNRFPNGTDVLYVRLCGARRLRRVYLPTIFSSSGKQSIRPTSIDTYLTPIQLASYQRRRTRWNKRAIFRDAVERNASSYLKAENKTKTSDRAQTDSNRAIAHKF